MTFSYDLTTDVGKVRLEIGDYREGVGIRPSEENLSDEEITALLVEEVTVGKTAARCCEILAREWAKYSDWAVGPRKESSSQISKRFTQLATMLRDQHGGGLATSFSTGFVRDDGYEAADSTTGNEL